ncbi:MAG: hypothetical protein WC043_08030 [Pseudobdellovibrionaceae bacterium]
MVYSLPQHNPQNPDPWAALAIDQTTFIDQAAKEALMRNNGTSARRLFLPILRPIARLSIGIMRCIRIFVPDTLTSSDFLHKTIVWGMSNFVSRDANYLILRHFNIGSQILRFLNDNMADGELEGHPLYPKVVADLRDNFFVQHDLNLYNFVILANSYLAEKGRMLRPVPLENINFSAIRPIEIDINALPDTWHNFLDLQSAIEIYTPLFALLLAREDFERASNSLQLDETVAVYVATLFNRESLIGMVNNKHPMVPLSTIESGFRLMLHGLDAENLHGFITYMKESANHPTA